MLAFDPLGNTPLGSFNTFQIYIATPASFSFETEDGVITVRGTPSSFEFEGVDGVPSYIYIANPSSFSFEAVEPQITITTGTPEFNFRTEDGEVTISASPSSFSFEAPLGLINLETSPPTFNFEGVDGVSSATGSVTLITDVPVFEFQGEDGVPSYVIDIQEIPDLVVGRSGTTITIDIRNLRNRNVNIYRAVLDGSNKGNFTLLDTTNSFPYQDTVTGEVKYKTAFVFTGNIGGSASSETGPKSMSRYAKE